MGFAYSALCRSTRGPAGRNHRERNMLGESYKSVRHLVEQECALDASQQEDGDGGRGRRPGRGSTVRSPSSHRPKIHTRQTLSALSCHQCDRNDIFQQLPSSLTASTLSFKHLQLRSYAVWIKAHMRLRNTYFSRKIYLNPILLKLAHIHVF